MRMQEWAALQTKLRSSGDVSALAARCHKHNYETLYAIYQQSYAREMARNFHLVKTNGQQIVESFKSGNSLLDIADWISLSPTMVARRVLELQFGLSRKATTAALRNPERIADKRLRGEVKLCVDCDEYAGPHMDRVRSVLGLEYEFRLMDELRALRLQFESEQDLRDRGCFKTPDVLLRVPVAFCGKVVCWVDSKAKFGDEFTLAKDYNDSVSSYVGRFGPGMVVYWFGLVEDCPTPMLQDGGLLVVDKFPSDVQMLPGSYLPPPSTNNQNYILTDSDNKIQGNSYS